MNREVPFTIKFLSDKTGVPKATLRAWHNRGLIGEIEKSEQGYPVFDGSTVKRVLLVKKCRENGYELSWIDNKTNEVLINAINSALDKG